MKRHTVQPNDQDPPVGTTLGEDTLPPLPFNNEEDDGRNAFAIDINSILTAAGVMVHTIDPIGKTGLVAKVIARPAFSSLAEATLRSHPQRFSIIRENDTTILVAPPQLPWIASADLIDSHHVDLGDGTPLNIATDIVLLSSAIGSGTHIPDVDPFILELAKSSRAFVANIEARIVASTTLRQAKVSRDLRRAELLTSGVKGGPGGITAPVIDGKSVEIREAQLDTLCSKDSEYVTYAGEANAYECELEAATLRAEACRELSRSTRLIIQALSNPLNPTGSQDEGAQ